MKPLPTPPPAPHPDRLAAPAWALVLALAALAPAGALAACVDEDKADPVVASTLPNKATAAAAAPANTTAKPAALPPELLPRRQLQALVQDAVLRSNGIGEARLLAEAAEQDVEEARAAKKPMAALTPRSTPA